MNDIDLALDDIDQAFLHLEFCIKLMCYCELDYIDRKIFDSDITVLLESNNVGFPNQNFQSLNSVIVASQIQVGVAFGVTAIVLDAACEIVGLKRNFDSRLPKDELRMLIYMVRNAFAHNVLAPRWKIQGKDFRRIFNLSFEGKQVSIDLSNLDTHLFEYQHIGGVHQWFNFKRSVVSLIRENQEARC